MIQATELRIGNLINIPESGVIATISAIGRRAFNIDVSKVDLDEADNYFDYESAHPIPLTPSILEKAGFEKIQEGSMAYPEVWRIKYTQVLVGSVIDIQIRGSEEIAWIEGNTIVHIHYVHQLQNLIYAITKQELTLNL